MQDGASLGLHDIHSLWESEGVKAHLYCGMTLNQYMA